MQNEPAPSIRPRSNTNTILKIGGIILVAVLLVALGMGIGYLTEGRWNRGGTQNTYGPGMMYGWNDAPDAGRGWGYDYDNGYGPGMMGGGRGWEGGGSWGVGPGMMGGWDGRGNSGVGPGMMGGYIPDSDVAPSDGERLTLDQAAEVANAYVAQVGDNLEVAEVMEFDNHFYAEIVESDTGIGAMEILIDPLTAAVYPEPGPNMMWNTQYGHMGGGRGRGMMGGWTNAPSGEMTITPEDALERAQAYLDAQGLDLTVGDEAEAFYGYYTIHTMKDGEIVGMLGVNGYTGDVWLHTWHGTFIGMTGEHED